MPTVDETPELTFDWPVRVYYEDTDAGGVVYHGRYLNFFERARTEWLRTLGYEQDRLREQEGILFAVRRVDIDYLTPARFNDALRLAARLTRVAGASLEFEQHALRDADGSCCCRAQVKLACVDIETLRPTRLPRYLASDLLALMRAPAESPS